MRRFNHDAGPLDWNQNGALDGTPETGQCARHGSNGGNGREDRVRRLERRLADLERERGSWEAQWRDLARHFLPSRSRWLEQDGGHDKRNTHLYDSTGRLAVRTLASGMQAGLTSPSRPWFQLSLSDEGMGGTEEGKAWLHALYTRMLGVFRGSNFYEQIHTLYSELAVFGTACMLLEEDEGRVARFCTLSAGEYVLDVDALGRVNTLLRRVRMTPAQIAEAWPESCPGFVRELAARNDPGRLEILHAVEPNPGWRDDGPANGPARPWLSTYLMMAGNREVLEESGYYEFPALCPRWETASGEVYGRSPAMDALADCRMLQRLAKDGLEALEMEVRPPLNISTGGNEPVDISPAALNYLPPAAMGQQVVSPLYQVRANLQALESYKAAIQTQIREALFNNLFLMLIGVDKRMTAAEVAERSSEKMLMLGPVLDRMRSELFQPLIERAGGILRRRGLVPPMPPALRGQGLNIEFVSVLAQAQKQSGIAAISQLMLSVGEMARVAPDVVDKIDGDETVDEIALMLGVPPRLIRSDAAVAEMRQTRGKAAEQRATLETLRAGVEIARDGAKAVKEAGDNPALGGALAALSGLAAPAPNNAGDEGNPGAPGVPDAAGVPDVPDAAPPEADGGAA